MIKSTSIFGYKITFVFKHRFTKDLFDQISHWDDYRLGVWFRRSTVVSKPKNGPAILGKNGTTSNCYMLGIDLIIFKSFVNISYRPLEIEI